MKKSHAIAMTAILMGGRNAGKSLRRELDRERYERLNQPKRKQLIDYRVPPRSMTEQEKTHYALFKNLTTFNKPF